MKKQPENILVVTPDTHDHHHAADDFTHLGMAADVNMMRRTPLSRRRVLAMGAVGVGLLLASCSTASAGNNGSDDDDDGGNNTGKCATLPRETAGPYPADGSRASGQTLNILNQTGVVRSDITQSLGTNNRVDGVAMNLSMTLVDVSNNCSTLSGYVIYA